jgi:hypothetical protein
MIIYFEIQKFLKFTFISKILGKISNILNFEFRICICDPKITIFKLEFQLSSFKFAKNEFLNFEISKKFWCASRAHVNLPNIGNRECFKFVLQKKNSFNLF